MLECFHETLQSFKKMYRNKHKIISPVFFFLFVVNEKQKRSDNLNSCTMN